MLGVEAPSADRAVIMIGRVASRRIVMAADAAAMAAGLRTGMPASKAQALVADLIIEPFQPMEDQAGLERLALWFLKTYAPVVAVDPPDGIVVDTTGADHLHGNEAQMIRGMVNRLGAMGIQARVAVADTWGAAHALARFGPEPDMIVPVGGAQAALARLPIAALRLEAQTVSGLRKLGFERIADLAATPRAPLALRFGPQIGRRLDQAFGRMAEPIDPIRIAEQIEVRRSFAEPISAAETIARYVKKCVVEICASLEHQGMGVRRLDMIFHRVDNTLQAIRAGTAKPVRDVERLSRLLCDRIQTIDPGFGIEIMVLTATHAEPLEMAQTRSSLIEAPEADISDLVDVICNRGHRVYRFAAVASDVPERSVRRIAAMAPDDGIGWPDHWPRPTRLFAHPEPIQTLALLPDHPPVNFTWRGIRHPIRRADGPERVFGEWWRRDKELAAVRDYYAVEDDAGERFWIYRAGDGEHLETGSQAWFIHGIF
jgi:protein ImuB